MKKKYDLGGILNGLQTVNSLAGMIPAAQPFTQLLSPVLGLAQNLNTKAQANKQMKAAQRQEALAAKQDILRKSQALLGNYPTQGVTSPQMGMGGSLIKYMNGGAVPLSSTGQMVVGNSHEQGGVDLMKQGQPIAEVEGGEVINQAMNQPFVSSDRLVNPATGMTFAQEMSKLETEKAKYEKLLQERPDDLALKNAIAKIEKQIDNLAMQQEQMKAQMGVEQQPVMALGGGLNSLFSFGNDVLDSVTKLPLKKGLQSPTMSASLQTKMPNSISTQGKPSIFQLLTSNINKGLTAAKENDITSLAPLLDNLFASNVIAQRSKEQVPVQRLTNYIQDLPINLDNQRADINRATTGLTQGLLNNSINSNTANSNLAAILAQRANSMGQVNREEANLNAQNRQAVQSQNAQIQTGNNQALLEGLRQQFAWKDSIKSQQQQNIADLGKDLQGMSRDKQASDIQNFNQMMSLYGANPESALQFITQLEQDPAMAKRFGIKDLASLKKRFLQQADAAKNERQLILQSLLQNG